MKKIGHYILAVVVAAVAYGGVKTLTHKTFDREPTHAEVTKMIDGMKAEAKREHPKMSESVGLKEVADEKSQQTLLAVSASQRQKTAADMFFGFFYMNTKFRVEYCEKQGIDIAPFATAFTQVHETELIQAKEIYKRAGQSPESVLRYLENDMPSAAAQDMKDLATGAGIPVESACTFVNENANRISEAIVLQPQVKQALMSTN